MCVLPLVMPDLERKNGITGVPFGRTELSIRASCRNISALESREGPVGPGIQGMPEKFDFRGTTAQGRCTTYE